MKLTIRDGQPFRICQLTDIHLGPAPLNAPSQQTLAALAQLLDQEAQTLDLIMITGDLIWGKQISDPEATLHQLYALLNRYPVPVAVTYGNHDTEGDFDRAKLRGLEAELVHLADKHHAQVFGERENYVLEVYNQEDLAHLLYVFDSGAYSQIPGIEGYAALSLAQINWFVTLPYARQAQAVDLGFLHIPLPEYNRVGPKLAEGEQNEPVCAAAINSGLFYQLRLRQNVKAVFAGHDHDNNFVGDYAHISLNYGNVTGYNTYGTLPRGVRMITVTPAAVQTHYQLFQTN